MFKSKTLFVIGAGASSEAGLPTGNELTGTIADKVDIKIEGYDGQISGDVEIFRALRSRAKDADEHIDEYLGACWRIRDAMPQASSIDEFIDNQGDDKIELCGKLAIVRSILKEEHKSLLFFDRDERDPRPKFKNLQETWYISFMRLLNESCRKEDIDKIFENVSFIIFNYDRCVEHFLYHSLQIYYGIGDAEAAGVMQRLEIIHPYGIVGNLPWLTDEATIPFGESVGGQKLLSLADQIKTFTERIEEAETVTRMRQLVQDAKIVVFLGFAFHQQNMDLIKPTEPSTAEHIFGTVKSMSHSNCESIREELIDNFFGAKPRAELNSKLSCHDLFAEYGRILSRS